MTRMTFSAISHGQLELLRLALAAAQLPTDDLEKPDRAFFQLAVDNEPIGFVGLQGRGADRLLRSLVVLPSGKRQGHGGLLVAHAEAVARRDGVERLHLLTTSAAGFYGVRGYLPADRQDAPVDIAGTEQFGSLCPSSATYLMKGLT